MGIDPCSGRNDAATPWSPEKLPKGPSQANWSAGYVGETAWWTVTNHGGGYQYRLCPSDNTQDDKCFEDGVLAFANDHSIMKQGATEHWVPVRDLDQGTHPPNSVWRLNEMAIASDGIKPAHPDLTGSAKFKQHDKIQVPMYPGTYTLQFRWDCEQTSQIWAHCADITILPVPYNMWSVAMAWNGWKCLNVVDGNTTNGNRVNVWDCNGQPDQQWIWKNGNLVFKKDQSKCLDVPGGNFASGQPMWIWDCDGSDNQRFSYGDEIGDGTFSLYSGDGSVCLDVAGGDWTNNNTIQLWECNGQDQQMWLIPDPINLQSGNVCIDLPGGNKVNGQPILVWECDQGENQAWLWKNWNMRFGPDLTKCLDLPGGDTTNGRQLWLWDCDGGENQQFGLNPDTGAIFVASDITKCVDAGDRYNGGSLIIWDCNNLEQQQWATPSLIARALEAEASVSV